MFKNKKLEVRLVEDQTPPAIEAAPSKGLDKEDVVYIVHETVLTVTSGVVFVIGAVFLTRTLEHIVTTLTKE